MPELPEVETIARDLDASVRGAVVTAVYVYRADVLRETTPRVLAKRLTGARIERWWRRAKYAIADVSSGDHLVVSPRFTGAILVEPPPFRRTAADYTVLKLRLADGRTLRYRDVRRLGTVALMTRARFEEWAAALGPEPFDEALTAERFAAAVRRSRRQIKTILMDQRCIAGVGNIYANEALWHARIRPSRRGRMVTRAEAARLLAEVRAVLEAAVAQRGTSFRDYRDPAGGQGGYLDMARVYGRAGEPCRRCGTILRSTHRIEGRVSVWCPACQR